MKTKTVDQRRRRILGMAVGVTGGVGLCGLAVPFVGFMLPSAAVQAEGILDVDIRNLQPGQLLVVPWRKQPLWVLRRTAKDLSTLNQQNERLQDPNSEESQQPDYAQNATRSIHPEILVLLGICTHLGCAPRLSPQSQAPLAGMTAWKGGFHCSCHDSLYDLSGRVHKGVPAPTNLTVPPYRYVSDTLLRIGEHPPEKS